MTTAVGKASLIKSAYDAIYNVINNRSYIPDPRNASSTSQVRKMVYDSDPFMAAVDFSLCPLIIVGLPTQEPQVKSADGAHQWLSWRQQVTLLTVRKGSGGGRTDTGMTDSLNMTDDILQTFKSQTILNTLRQYYVYNLECEIVSNDTSTYDDELVFETIFEIRYRMRIVVS